MRHLPLLALVLTCVACSGRGLVPDLSMPDFSSWFDSEHAVPVEEVARASVCHTADGESGITVLQNLAALRGWAAARGVDLVSTRGTPLPDTPYAVVEFGQRPNSGYGLAVSRTGGLRDDTLVLKATYFEPTKDRWASSEPSSPCVMVSLPARDYAAVKVIDQTGRVRAASAGRSS